MFLNLHVFGSVKASDLDLTNQDICDKFMEIKLKEHDIAKNKHNFGVLVDGQRPGFRTFEELIDTVAYKALRLNFLDFHSDEPKYFELRRFLTSEEPIPISREEHKAKLSPVICSWGKELPFENSRRHDARPMYSFVNLLMIWYASRIFDCTEHKWLCDVQSLLLSNQKRHNYMARGATDRIEIIFSRRTRLALFCKRSETYLRQNERVFYFASCI